MFNGHENESLLVWKARKNTSALSVPIQACSCYCLNSRQHSSLLSLPSKDRPTHRLTSLKALMALIHFIGHLKDSSCQRKDKEKYQNHQLVKP